MTGPGLDHTRTLGRAVVADAEATPDGGLILTLDLPAAASAVLADADPRDPRQVAVGYSLPPTEAAKPTPRQLEALTLHAVSQPTLPPCFPRPGGPLAGR